MNIRNVFFTAILSLLLQRCSAQNYVVEIEPSGTKIIKGVLERQHLENDSLFSWYKYNYDSYAVDSAAIKEIEPLLNNIHFVLVIGTWCSDSKRDVPHLYKIFDAANISDRTVFMFGVDRTKKSQDGTTEKYNILRVPTLIVFNGEQEIGRIVEHPRATLEKDILKILNGNE